MRPVSRVWCVAGWRRGVTTAGRRGEDGRRPRPGGATKWSGASCKWRTLAAVVDRHTGLCVVGPVHGQAGTARSALAGPAAAFRFAGVAETALMAPFRIFNANRASGVWPSQRRPTGPPSPGRPRLARLVAGPWMAARVSPGPAPGHADRCFRVAPLFSMAEHPRQSWLSARPRFPFPWALVRACNRCCRFWLMEGAAVWVV